MTSKELELHKHEFLNLPTDAYGEAINSVIELENETLWVSNGEYASQVNFCPICGYKAKKFVVKI